MKNSIRGQLFLATFGMTILPLIVAGSILIWTTYRIQMDHAIEHQGEIATHAGYKVKDYLYLLETELDLVTHIRDLIDLEKDDLQVVLSKLEAYHNAFSDISLLDRGGQEVARVSNRQYVARKDLRDRSESDEYLRIIQKADTYYSQVYIDKMTGEPFMTMAVPIIDPRSGLVEGILVSEIRLKSIWDLVIDINLGESGLVYIVGSEGKIIAHRSPTVVLRGTRFDVPDVTGFHMGLDGNWVVLASHHVLLGDYEFVVVAERPMAEALNLTIRTVFALTIMVLFAATSAVFLGFMIMRQVVRPVETLASVAQAIAKGELSQRAAIETDNEVGTLAEAFNSMAAELGSMLDALEMKVDERTEELRAAQIATLSMMEDVEEARQRTEQVNEELRAAQIATMNIMMDVEEAREKAEHSQKRYRSLFEESPIALKEEDHSEMKLYLDELGRDGVDVKDILNKDISIVEKCSTLVKVSDVNQEAVALFGAQEKSDLLGYYDVINPEAVDVFREEIKAFIDGQTSFENEFIQTKLTGEKVWLISRISIAPGYEESWGKVLVSTLDISDLKRIEQALLSEKIFSETMVNSLPGIFYVIDENGKFLRWNKNFSIITEYSDDEFAHISPTDLFKGPDKELIAERIKEVFVEGESSAEAKLVSKSGNTWPYYFTGLRMIYDGNPKLIGTGMDITDRIEAQSAIEEKAEELTRSNRELEQFAYVASHDLQEPLRMVASYLQLLERRYGDNLDENAKEFIDFAVDGATRMKVLINDLLAYSRVGTRGDPFSSTDLDNILAQVLDNLQTIILEQQAVITHDELPTLVVDATQMMQVFQNLIGNAIKFRGDENPLVHISAEKLSDEWKISICDNGIGIAPEFYERIFIIFQRLHTRREYSGTGIGLAISKRIIERHGGRIWVDSVPGEGSAFSFTIPEKKRVKLSVTTQPQGEKPEK